MNKILDNWLSTLTSTIAAAVIVSLIIGTVMYVQNAYARESRQEQQIMVLEKQSDKLERLLAEQIAKYNDLKDLIIEINNNQKHIIKQLDKIVANKK